MTASNFEKVDPHPHVHHRPKKTLKIPSPPPLVKPPFTLKDLHDVIPPHCFHRSLTRSFGHLALNLSICLILFYLATFITTSLQFLWPLYWFLQGVYMEGLWIIAHEAGHHAFSEIHWLNDAIGFILHSSLLVPYQSWRASHRHHHRISGNCDDDQVYLPPTRSSIQSSIVELLEESPLYNIVSLVFMLTLGLMPGYLFSNLSGPRKFKKGSSVSSFDPNSALFLAKQSNDILLATLGVLTAFLGLVSLSVMYGFGTIVYFYGIPYLICNCFVVLITFLHHTDVYVPRFREPEWNWLRGALCTVDRSFGPWLDHAFHHISDTHVCHHLFPTMPFYHAVEATQAITKVLGPYHLKDDTPILKALFRSYRNCKFVEDEGAIVFYKRNLRQI